MTFNVPIGAGTASKAYLNFESRAKANFEYNRYMYSVAIQSTFDAIIDTMNLPCLSSNLEAWFHILVTKLKEGTIQDDDLNTFFNRFGTHAITRATFGYKTGKNVFINNKISADCGFNPNLNIGSNGNIDLEEWEAELSG